MVKCEHDAFRDVTAIGELAHGAAVSPDHERVFPGMNAVDQRADDHRALRIEIVARPVDVRQAHHRERVEPVLLPVRPDL